MTIPGTTIDFDDKDLGMILLAVLGIIAMLKLGADGKELVGISIGAIAAAITGRPKP